MSDTKQRLEDHSNLLATYRLAERWVELLEQVQAPDAEEQRELLRTVARTKALDRILDPNK